MVQPIDQGAILRSGQSLVPDYAAQELDRRQVAMQEQQLALTAQRQMQALAQARREEQQAADFQAAMDDYLTDPDSPTAARKMAGLLGRFPQFREQIEGAWKGLDSAKQNADLRSLGEIYSAGEAQNYTLAADILQARIDAETASGMPADPTDIGMVQALKSGDPIQQRAAIRQAGLLLEVASGGKLSTTAKPTADEQNYEWRVRTFGRAEADKWRAIQDDKFVPVQGVGVFRGSDLIGEAPSGMPGIISGYGGGTFNMDGSQATPSQYGIQEGGDPASDEGGIASRILSRAKQSKTISAADYATLGQMLGPEGRQSMQQWLAANGVAIAQGGAPSGPVTGTTAPVRVRSVQEYNKLRSGTQYVAPDGSLRRKP